MKLEAKTTKDLAVTAMESLKNSSNKKEKAEYRETIKQLRRKLGRLRK